MKILKYLFVLSLIFTSCKSVKNVTDSKSIKGFTAKTLTEKHLATNFSKKTIDAKLNVKYKSPSDSHSFSVQMKIKKDEVIYLKGTKFITVFKALITPKKVQFYSPFTKQYFDGDFSMLGKFLGVDVNFEQLQNMLLGQAMLDIKKDAHSISYSGQSYHLAPKKQDSKYEVFYFINPKHFKLDRQNLVNSSGKLNIYYPKYTEKNGVLFPKKMQINTTEKEKNSQIELVLRSVSFGNTLSMPFKIPTGYKEIKL